MLVVALGLLGSVLHRKDFPANPDLVFSGILLSSPLRVARSRRGKCKLVCLLACMMAEPFPNCLGYDNILLGPWSRAS
jgi:hypothetical protein